MPRTTVPANVRRRVSERAEKRCEYCRSDEKYADSPFDADHIIPVSLGGTSEPENLAWSCHGCNLFKGNRIKAYDIVTENDAPLFDPRKQEWNEHFAWSTDGSLIVGLSATGRVTIVSLKLNRSGLVNQRKVLIQLDLHPNG